MIRKRKLLQVVCAAWACLGMVCVGPDGPTPSLPRISLEDIHLRLLDPADGRAAAWLDWTWPAGEKASYFEIYLSLDPDSLGSPVMTRPAPDSTSALVPLADSTRGSLLYFGVRAVLVEATGQKSYGDSIPTGTLSATSSVNILKPAPGGFHSGRTLDIEVQTSSDDGISLRQSLHEKTPKGWLARLDTCLPMEACQRTIFGGSIQRDALTVQGIASGDTVETLFCVTGDESFEDDRTGRKQSLGCSRFFRVEK